MIPIPFKVKPLVTTLFVAWSVPALALHLGTPSAISYIGDNLVLEIPVLGTTPEEFSSVTAKSVSYPYAPKFIGHPEYRVVVKSNTTNPTLVVTSDAPVTDSVLDIAISVSYSAGNMIQPVTAVLDNRPTSNISTKSSTVIPVELPPVVSHTIEEKPAPISPDVPVTSVVPEAANTINSIPVIDVAYTMSVGDTFYSVAHKTKPDRYTLAEWMSSIYQANPVLKQKDFSQVKTLILPYSIKVDPHKKANVELNPSKSNTVTKSVSVKTPVTQDSTDIKPSKPQAVHVIKKELTPVSSSTAKYLRKTEQLAKTESRILKLEAEVNKLLMESKRLDSEIEKRELELNKTNEHKKIESINNSSKKNKLKTSMYMPVFESDTKGLLAVINAYSSLKG